MEEAIRQAAAGSREAMGRIVGEYYADVYRFCARRVRSDLAEDAAQETFVTAQKAIKQFDGRSSLRTWLFGIANNQCRNLARKRRFEITLDEALAKDSPETGLIQREALRMAMAKLSIEHREVVVMHEIEGLGYDEIGSVLGIPSGTVKSRLHHAFLNLRQSLGPEVAR